MQSNTGTHWIIKSSETFSFNVGKMARNTFDIRLNAEYPINAYFEVGANVSTDCEYQYTYSTAITINDNWYVCMWRFFVVVGGVLLAK